MARFVTGLTTASKEQIKSMIRQFSYVANADIPARFNYILQILDLLTNSVSEIVSTDTIYEYTFDDTLADGDSVYLDITLPINARIIQMIASGKDLDGDVGAKLQVGIETDDEDYMTAAELDIYNDLYIVDDISPELTVTNSRIIFTAVDGDITSGAIKIRISYI